MIISSGIDDTGNPVTGGSTNTRVHPLGPTHPLAVPVTIRNQAADGQLHLKNSHYLSNDDTIGLSLQMDEMVAYVGVHFKPNVDNIEWGGLWESISDAGNLQGGRSTGFSPHPILYTLDAMFGTFGTLGFVGLAISGSLTYYTFSDLITTNWPGLQDHFRVAKAAGSVSALVVPWNIPVDTELHPFAMIEKHPSSNTFTATSDFEFGIATGNETTLTQGDGATPHIANGNLDNLFVLGSTLTLANNWVGTSQSRGSSDPIGITQSAYQDNLYHGLCRHVSPETEFADFDLASSDMHVLYIPYVRVSGSDSWVPSNNLDHYTFSFMSGTHLQLDALRARPADASADYWMVQKSVTTHNMTSLSFNWGTRSLSTAVPYVQTTYALATTASAREVTWSGYSNSQSALCEVVRNNVPGKYQITPVFVAKDMIHLTITDNSTTGVLTGFDTVVTIAYPVGRSMASNLTHKVTVPVMLASVNYGIDLIFCAGPKKGKALLQSYDVAGVSLLHYLAGSQSSRDSLGSTANLSYGTQIEVKYGWMTRERAPHSLPQILLTLN